MTPRPLTTLFTVGAVAVLAACSSSGSTSGPTSPSTTSATSTATSGTSVTPAALAAKMKGAAATITSAQLKLDATLLSAAVHATGPAKFAAGELVGVDLTGTVQGFGKLRVIAVGSKTYAEVPSLNKSAKPWLPVTATSSNLVAAQLGGALTGIRTAASLNNLATLVGTAATLTDKGHVTIAGTPTTAYSFLVDASKLAGTFPNKSDYAGRLKGSPIELWVDAQGRPVKVTTAAIVQGAKVPITITASDFDKPVTITAPPASQVASG